MKMYNNYMVIPSIHVFSQDKNKYRSFIIHTVTLQEEMDQEGHVIEYFTHSKRIGHIHLTPSNV